MPAYPGIDRRPQLVRVRDRSQRLAAKSRDSRRSRSTASRPEVHEPQLPVELEHQAVSPIPIAHLIAEAEHRQLLLTPGTADVQRVLDQIQGPFFYLGSHERLRARRRIVGRLLGSTDRLITATEHAPEPICSLDYVGARALLRALELWFWIEDQADRA